MAGFAFPEAFKAFLSRSNGGDGFVGEYYVILWRAGELAEFNRGYEAPIHAPELFLIGSDGGGEAIAFDRRDARLPIVQVPFIGLELEYADVLAARHLLPRSRGLARRRLTSAASAGRLSSGWSKAAAVPTCPPAVHSAPFTDAQLCVTGHGGTHPVGPLCGSRLERPIPPVRMEAD